ncbi:MAG: sugar phosphate isomerase/epimerase family protein [Candidatus Bathyarchaeia archaeon]|nr:sugar phosphate isomerase/epimerase [Candidatus Bathyarchaeota archaeon]
MGKPKIGVSIYSYGADIRRRRMSVKDAISHAASLGVDGIELVDKQHIPNYPYPSVYDLQDLRDYIESFGMVVSCYSTYVDRAVRSDREATREEMLKTICDQIGAARVLGARVIRPTILLSSRLSHDYEGFKAHAEEVADIIRVSLPYVKRYGLKWGTEVHAPMPPEVLCDMVKRINDKDAGLVPDFSVWAVRQQLATHIAGRSPLQSLRDIMPYAVHVHAKAHAFDGDGEEVNTPYRELLAIIKESGYDGYISAEFEGWWEGKDFDSRKIVEIHVNLLKKYL